MFREFIFLVKKTILIKLNLEKKETCVLPFYFSSKNRISVKLSSLKHRKKM